MKRVWKPLDMNGLRAYQVKISFPGHPQWNSTNIVMAKSPRHAQSIIEAIHKETEWLEEPIIHGEALNILQPEEWFE